jgi:hypothetical protein
MNHQQGEEELSKKSYEVVLPLDKNVVVPQLDYASCLDEDVQNLSDGDEDGRPVCNTWNGQNYKLPVLGDQDAFQKHLQSFQVPKTAQVHFDPQGRMDCGDYPVGEAFILWESKRDLLPLKALETCSTEEADTICPMKNSLETFSSDSEDERGPEPNDSKPQMKQDDDDDSDTETEIYQFIKSQKLKKHHGTNLTGELLWYDEEYKIIRNLHRSSISLTDYGKVNGQCDFGKTQYMFDQLTNEEQRSKK